ncbi:MAG: UDP-N-acetylglucosamine 2-epimerase [Coriobacteriia bacterium]|nr:UDP-N-acetylglucosamine 2-epimerase [Coriobacteriia bacterium]
MGATRIQVITGTRADYGLLHPLITLLEGDPEFDVAVVVTGTHLSERFGLTVREIEAHGHRILARIPIGLDDDSEAGVTKATAEAMAGFADVFARDRPDLVVILGDRTEALAAATAALLTRVPIAHIHGGELTAGATDDAIRHAITKMSWLHFASTEEYRRRIIQLGEDPSRVYCVGAPGVDNALNTPLLTRAQLEADLGPVFGSRTALVTFHPVTLEDHSAPDQFASLAAALGSFPDLSVIVTKPNADAGNRDLFDALARFAEGHPESVRVFDSLGVSRYLSILAQADVCVGNSSSGIIESPALGTPTVDIGDRQAGRVSGASVLHCDPEEAAIRDAVARALTPEMQALAARRVTPYGDGRATHRIADILRSATPGLGSIKKHFHDLPEGIDHTITGDHEGGPAHV